MQGFRYSGGGIRTRDLRVMRSPERRQLKLQPHGNSAEVLSDQPMSAQHGTTNGTTTECLACPSRSKRIRLGIRSGQHLDYTDQCQASHPPLAHRRATRRADRLVHIDPGARHAGPEKQAPRHRGMPNSLYTGLSRCRRRDWNPCRADDDRPLRSGAALAADWGGETGYARAGCVTPGGSPPPSRR
jgi:hypothetical protein